jgi:hypothetical protein
MRIVPNPQKFWHDFGMRNSAPHANASKILAHIWHENVFSRSYHVIILKEFLVIALNFSFLREI